jgi:molybdenum cofactor synthesis domain-containing protein
MRVALVTVGDELLAGETVNTNAAWLGRTLHERGHDVERSTVIPDTRGAIARVVNEYHAEYDAVIVTGGIGPTHDDVTMAGVAAAFGRELATSEEALEWIETHRDYSRADLTDGTGEVPAGARILPNHVGVAPGCVIMNCYVLPGVPAEMKRMYEEIADEFEGDGRYVETVETPEPESALLDRLATVQEQFAVTVGCYPGENVTVRFADEDQQLVAEAAAWFSERVESPEKQ